MRVRGKAFEIANNELLRFYTEGGAKQHLILSSRKAAFGERSRGNTIRSNGTESLREENLPPRGSPRRSPKTAERRTGNEDQVTKGDPPEVFGGPLRGPLGGRFSSGTLSPVAPNRVDPYSFSRPNKGGIAEKTCL